MKYISKILIIYFVFLSGIITSQTNAEVFDLLIKLRLAVSDTTKMDIYTQLADVYVDIDPKKALNNANLALILARNYNDKRRELLALEKFIKIYLQAKKDLPKAMEYLSKAKSIKSPDISISDKALLYGHKGRIFMELEDFEKSSNSFLTQLSIYEKVKYDPGLAKVFFDLGTLFYKQNDFDNALSYFKKALAKYKILGKPAAQVKTLNAIGKTFGQLKNYLKNLQYCSEALTYAQNLTDDFQLAHINLNIGFAYLNLDQKNNAYKFYENAFVLGSDLEDNQLISLSANQLGNINFDFGDEKKALNFYNVALKAANKLKAKPILKDTYESLYKFYKSKGNDKNAYEFLIKLTDIKDEILSDEKAINLINSRIRYETAKKEKENRRLKEQELKNNLTINSQKVKNYILMIIVIMTFGVITVLYNAFRRKKEYNKHLELEVAKRTNELTTSYKHLQDSNQKLEESNTELERFAYIASHDLKSPLRNIISFLSLIERKLDKKDDTLMEYLGFAKNSAKQMFGLIKDVLEFSKINNGTHNLQDVDMNDSLVVVLKNLKEMMEEKNVSVFSERLPIVQANNFHIIQLLQNIISNGIKYNESNEPKITIIHEGQNGYHKIAVKDNGIGIEPEYQDQVFQMFKRLHPNNKYNGTGIGLATCKKIINNLGGDISLVSTPGEGTTFVFSIPK